MKSGLHTYISNERFNFCLHYHEDILFLHMDVKCWNHSTLKELRIVVNELASTQLSEGYEMLFAVTDDKQVLKFWNMVRICDEVREFGDNNELILGCWNTEK